MVLIGKWACTAAQLNFELSPRILLPAVASHATNQSVAYEQRATHELCTGVVVVILISSQLKTTDPRWWWGSEL